MDNNKQGTFGEFKAMQVYTEMGYDVFVQLSNSSPFDFVAYKDGKCTRVEVKTTRQRAKSNGLKYMVKVNTKRGHGDMSRDVSFDSSQCDEVFVYIPEQDYHVILVSTDLHGMCSKTVEVLKENK